MSETVVSIGVYRDHSRRGFGMVIVVRGEDGAESVVMPDGRRLSVEDANHHLPEVTAQFDESVGQRLMDQLWHAGLRPEGVDGGTGEIAAMREHPMSARLRLIEQQENPRALVDEAADELDRLAEYERRMKLYTEQGVVWWPEYKYEDGECRYVVSGGMHVTAWNESMVYFQHQAGESMVPHELVCETYAKAEAMIPELEAEDARMAGDE